MVEMSETSAILHTATSRSLVLLDEIGRGTATYDGVSIAWSVSEHLHDAIGCKTVFATHYHELTQLAEELTAVRNFTVAVREVGEQVLFLHRLIPGGADRSYGIEVGRLAGLPAPVISRAKEVLALLEGDGAQMAARLTGDGLQAPTGARTRGPRHVPGGRAPEPREQLGFFGETARGGGAPGSGAAGAGGPARGARSRHDDAPGGAAAAGGAAAVGGRPARHVTSRAATGWKPGKAELAAAVSRTVPDVIAPGLRVLFCGINPGLYTAAIGHHFGRPGNRFWPVLHDVGVHAAAVRAVGGAGAAAAGAWHHERGVAHDGHGGRALARGDRGRRGTARADGGALFAARAGRARRGGVPYRVRASQGRGGTAGASDRYHTGVGAPESLGTQCELPARRAHGAVRRTAGRGFHLIGRVHAPGSTASSSCNTTLGTTFRTSGLPIMPRSLAPIRYPRAIGATLFLALVACSCSTDAPAADDGQLGASPLTVRRRTPVYVADVVREYAHDTAAFTQGLIWHEGEMYESTGEVGGSSIRRVSLDDGKVLQKRDLPAPHFGEGIAIVGEKLFQLTWTSGIAYVYDRRTFEPRGEFRYQGEGWGLTTDGTQLVMSDGSATLRYLDPETFTVTRRLEVTENGTPVRNLNELEWVKGEIWANVWTTDNIARIDAQTGAVIGWINLTGLLPANVRTGREDVLNGIAYDASGDRIFVTGKRWARLYQISLRPQR